MKGHSQIALDFHYFGSWNFNLSNIAIVFKIKSDFILIECKNLQ